MTDILHWIGNGLAFLFVGVVLAGFWRGLSLKPTDPGTRAPEHLTWLVGRW